MVLPHLNNALPIVRIPNLLTNEILTATEKIQLTTKKLLYFQHLISPQNISDLGREIAHVTTIAYEIQYYPDYATLLKSILIQASVLKSTPPLDTHINFIPYDLIQNTYSTSVKNQII